MGLEVIQRIKALANLDASDSLVPQDGRFPFPISTSKTVEFRVTSLPVIRGEKLILKIVDPAVTQVPLDQLGYDKDQLEALKAAIKRRRGLILFAGPVGSGKTVCLYTALSQLDPDALNISTVEDPVEVYIDGINQCAVNPARGLDHASALTSMLASDPEVVMVSELPDLATARTAFKAAQRGHLVLSAVETNSAPETLTYLARLGIHSHYLATSISLIVAQRLVRRLCPECRSPVELTREQLVENGFPEARCEESVQVFQPAGCEQCDDGYRGRIGLFEVVPVQGPVAEVVLSGGDARTIADACQQAGCRNLVQSGLARVFDGITSLDEVRRVTGR